MTNKIWLLSIVLLVGCEKKAPVPQIPVGTVTESNVTLQGEPDFEKSWTAQLSEHRTIKVTSVALPWMGDDFDNYSHSIRFSDRLEQANGNWVDFDCNNIADKIIDARLVEEIRPYCASLHATAKDYWKSRHYAPDTFTDSTGAVWQRVK